MTTRLVEPTMIHNEQLTTLQDVYKVTEGVRTAYRCGWIGEASHKECMKTLHAKMMEIKANEKG